ncbi:MAG: hypothetical protein SCH71_04560 [Desulfobulbaceae bacterium]|nr:hypothetical protein [Desulfobulbaceae bacterium]
MTSTQRPTVTVTETELIRTVQHNCDISDARDNGIYSICMLVLKLRNLYKWETGIEPWEEPESGDLLNWIDAKENYWEKIIDEPYLPISIDGLEIDSYDVAAINRKLAGRKFLYGAGYGRSLKSIFFLADIITADTVEGCPVFILGREEAKELSSPFAMLQDGTVIIRREPLRFFFWDHIQEIRSSSRASLHHALKIYGILEKGRLSQEKFRDRLDVIVDQEIPIFIYHEIGEKMQQTFGSHTLRKIISTFPDSAIEYVSRAVKDVLADTHPQGMVSYIIREQREASLGFYIGLLAGLRKELFPQLAGIFDEFLKNRDWQVIDEARRHCREKNLRIAEKITDIAQLMGNVPAEKIQLRFNEEILIPLGLDAPEK